MNSSEEVMEPSELLSLLGKLILRCCVTYHKSFIHEIKYQDLFFFLLLPNILFYSLLFFVLSDFSLYKVKVG